MGLRKILTIGCAFWFLLYGSPVDAWDVLILHSYNEGYTWTDDVTAGIRHALRDTPGIRLFVEHLDARRKSGAGPLRAADNLLRARYSDNKPAVIIAADDDAFNFLLVRRDYLFPSVPIVFCGVNDFHPSRITDFPGITGVNEAPDVKGTLELILRLHPDLKELAVIADVTTAGVLNRARFERAALTLPRSLRITRLFNMEKDRLGGGLRGLPKNSAVLYLSYLSTPSGASFSVPESVALVKEATKAPIYGCWDFLLPEGIVGGKVLSGRRQGEEAGRMAALVLSGREPGSIPVLMNSPHEYRFNYRELRSRGISVSNLPPGSVVLGGPAGIPMIYKIGGLVLLAVIALLAALLMFAASSRRRHAKAELRYRTLAENIPAIVYTVDLGPPSRTVHISPPLETVLGYKPEEWIGVPDLWIQSIVPDERTEVREKIAEHDKSGAAFLLEYHAVRRDGEIRYLRNRGDYLFDSHNKPQTVIGVIFDATRERASEEAVRESLKEKEYLLKEIHHRVKNNFQIVSSLLRLQRGTNEDPKTDAALLDAERRIFAMSLVHERIYREGTFGLVAFKEYITFLAHDLRLGLASENDILCEVRGDEVEIPLDLAVPCGLFCNEVLVNAFKHAFPPDFPGEKRIQVTIRYTDGLVTLRIADTGVGIPEEIIRRVNMTADGGAAGLTLGLSLLPVLAAQIRGRVSIEGNGGTTVRLEFGINEKEA
jgi:PAS domain S-box-containing protein